MTKQQIQELVQNVESLKRDLEYIKGLLYLSELVPERFCISYGNTVLAQETRITDYSKIQQVVSQCLKEIYKERLEKLESTEIAFTVKGG